MNTRRVTVALGAAAGGLVASAFLSTAAAFADTYVVDPGSPLDVTAQDGFPPLYDQASGAQLFNIVDSTASTSTSTDVVGQYHAAVSDIYGPNNTIFNQEQVVLNDSTASGSLGVGTTAGDEPPVGSVFDTTNFGGGYENVYSDILSTTSGTPNTISDTFITPFGDFNIPTTFDAAAFDSLNNTYSTLITDVVNLTPALDYASTLPF